MKCYHSEIKGIGVEGVKMCKTERLCLRLRAIKTKRIVLIICGTSAVS